MDAAVLGDRLLEVTECLSEPRWRGFAVPDVRGLKSVHRVSICRGVPQSPHCDCEGFKEVSGGSAAVYDPILASIYCR